MKIQESTIREIFYEAQDQDIEIFTDLFNNYSEKYDIISKFDVSAFLAQIFVEVGPTLLSTRENLNYSCDALIATFSYYMENETEAYEDGRCNNHEANQVNIGNKAYANRLGNSDVDSGDGYRFRGGGYFQLTGRDHYTDMAKGIESRIQIEVSPEKLADHITETFWGLASAMAYWQKYCTHCSEIEDINCVTSAVNYYTDSYDERAQKYQEIYNML